MSQYEQENDLGRGGGEVDEEIQEQAWETRERVAGVEDPVAETGEFDEDIERRS